MRTSDFEYNLPENAIAQEPWPVRDECKLLIMDRRTGALEDRIFRDIVNYLEPGDVLVANETRVLPARLLGFKRGTGGAAEVFLLREVLGREAHTAHSAIWEVLVRPGKRLKPGAIVDFFGETAQTPTVQVAKDIEPLSGQADEEPILSAEILDFKDSSKGERIVRLTTPLASLDEAMHAVGHTPLPPYIHDYAGDEEMYQTVYSKRETSAAAPTAGLHFTPELIAQLQETGVVWKTVELQVGIDTFRIVEEDDPADHAMHTETYSVPQGVVDACNAAHAAGKRVIAVGTTSVRSLESAWDAAQGKLLARNNDSTQLFLTPGSEFHVVDGIITNFHVPRSTLMMLVSAFSTRDHIMAAYEHALASGYRFLSFGDAMFIC
ncbi:MAG: tRNA preQ1(34) S-adenosylmethionine ribosyltransferase-isomerase QueA [Eggerthellaceae bacterium]|nr:tRNA preQ1(34) S-adenosylmethionine ribosyltransferase-isomerase QueA [Eggerthellaceae bacterium]